MGGGIVGLRGFVAASNLRISRCGCQFTGGKKKKFNFHLLFFKFLKQKKLIFFFPPRTHKKPQKGGFHFGSVWTVDASTGGLGPIKDFVVEDCFSGMNSGGLSVIA